MAFLFVKNILKKYLTFIMQFGIIQTIGYDM